MTPCSVVSTSWNASMVRRRVCGGGGGASSTSTNLPGSMSRSLTSTATAAMARCADGANGSGLVTTTSGVPSNRSAPRRNSGQSIVIVSNSPPSPQQCDPYVSSIVYSVSRASASVRPRSLLGTSPMAATLHSTASTSESHMVSSIRPCGCLHRYARLTRPKSAHTASTRSRW